MLKIFPVFYSVFQGVKFFENGSGFLVIIPETIGLRLLLKLGRFGLYTFYLKDTPEAYSNDP